MVSRDEAIMLIHGLDRPDGAAPVRYAEGSMKNGFGLTHLHKFLSVPFLQLQVGKLAALHMAAQSGCICWGWEFCLMYMYNCICFPRLHILGYVHVFQG